MQEMEYREVLEQLRKEMEELCLVNAAQEQRILHLQDELKRTLRRCHMLEKQMELAAGNASPNAAGAEKKGAGAAAQKAGAGAAKTAPNNAAGAEKKGAGAAAQKAGAGPQNAAKEKKTSIVEKNKAAAVSAGARSPEKVRPQLPRWKRLMRKFHADPYTFFQESKHACLRPLRHLYSPK